jgi:hypothetical protein
MRYMQRVDLVSVHFSDHSPPLTPGDSHDGGDVSGGRGWGLARWMPVKGLPACSFLLQLAQGLTEQDILDHTTHS